MRGLFHGLAWPIRVALGLLFVYAGALKLADPRAFLDAIETYRILPGYAYALPVVYVLPWLEILAGVGLQTRDWRRASGWILLVMLIAFTALILLSLFRGLDISCGCFGGTGDSGYTELLIRDLVLLAGAVWIVRADSLSAHTRTSR
jgi:uncharacterized membrane protein YphA (DoxX/SURF4 family)